MGQVVSGRHTKTYGKLVLNRIYGDKWSTVVTTKGNSWKKKEKANEGKGEEEYLVHFQLEIQIKNIVS